MSVGQPGETGVLQFPRDSPASRCTGAHALLNPPPWDVGLPPRRAFDQQNSAE